LCSVSSGELQHQPRLYQTTITDVTQSKRAEAVLRESEQRFRQLAESIREVFWMTDAAKTQMIYISPGYEQIWGRTCESLRASPRDWLEAIHPDDRQRVLEAAFSKQLSGLYDEQYRIVRPDGSIRWIEDRAFPIADESGQIYRIAGLAEDITERKMAEQRLLARNAVARALAESATVDEAARRILQSLAESLGWEMAAMWQVDAQASELRCLSLWFPPKLELQPLADAIKTPVFEEGAGLPGRIWSQAKPIWIADAQNDPHWPESPFGIKTSFRGVFAFPIHLRHEVLGVIGLLSRQPSLPDHHQLEMVHAIGGLIGQFIARKQAEEQVATLAHAVESTTEPICITDLEDRFTFVNRAFLQTYGYTEGEILGKKAGVLCSPNNPPTLLAQILQQTRSGGGWRGEVVDRRKDGTEFPIFLSTSQIKDQTGKVTGLLGVAQDITERKRAEEQIRLMADALQSSQELVSLTDQDNRFTFVNRAFLEAYGYEKEDVLGRTPDFLYSRSSPAGQCDLVFQQTLTGGWTGELLNCRNNGSEFPILLRTSPIRNSQGQMLGLMGVATDISDRKRAERETAAFSGLGYRLSAATAPEQAAKIILEIATELFGWDAGYVHLYSPTDNKITPVLTVDTIDGQRQPIPPSTAFPNPTPLMRQVLNSGAQLINRRPDSPLNLTTLPFGDLHRPSASLLCVPIRSSGAVVGFLSIQSYRPEAYSNDDLMLLQAFADFCGDALRRIEVAEALREAEAKYRSIFENATEGIFRTTPAGRYLSANPALARMFGYDSPEELIANIADIERQTYVLPQKRQELKHLLETQPSVVGFEAERYRKDGSTFWISINGRAVKDSTGALLYYEGTNQDITERHRAEIVLRESEEKFRTLFEFAPMAVALHSANGKFLQINRAYRKMLGFTEEELRRLGVKKVTHDEDVAEGKRLYTELRDGKRNHYHREKRFLRKDGELVWARSSASAVRDSRGKLRFIVSMIEDITERKRLENELLEISASERRRIGHELHDGLGQYLAGIAFRAKALEQMLENDRIAHAAEAKSLAALISNAISQTRSLARGLDPVEVETIGLPAALQNLAAETEKFFSINCRFNCPDSPCVIDSQTALALYRIAQEGIHNATNHGRARTIDIELTIQSKNLDLKVNDDGQGFDPQARIETGMGLRVMHYRARSIGANLTISSQPNCGTQILCQVPRGSSLAAAKTTGTPRLPEPTPSADSSWGDTIAVPATSQGS
jgi:PAS domain S-box-containing protein